MTEAEYERERARIAKTKAEAGIRWEQELARLLNRSGWTQRELAKKEGLSPQRISYLLRFGQFLAFLENSTSVEFAGLYESRFRSYWVRVSRLDGRGQSGLYNRERFREVARLMAEESGGWVKAGHRKYPPLPSDTATTIIKKCGDGKWRSPAQIASRVGLNPEDAPRVVHLVQHHKHLAKTESKKVGKETHYCIFKIEKTVGTDELTTKLTPILEELEAEGKKNMATMVPAKVAMLTARIKQLLKEWAE
jgi:transcriptional regulator with XRE-family HTH domain